MIFADERDALAYARENNLRIYNSAYTDSGFEVDFGAGRVQIERYQKEWEEEQPYWGIYTVISNGSRMFKSDVDTIAKKLRIPKSKVRDTTFNVYEAQLMSKRQAEQKAYYLTRNGRYLWQAVRLKY